MLKTHDARAHALEGVTLFRGCSKKELQALARITTEVAVPEGRVLCREGDYGQECFIIISGEAGVTIGADDVATIGPGGVVGEMALLDGGPRVATVTALTEMDLLVLSRSEFDRLLDDFPKVSRRMLEAFAARLRGADAALHEGKLGT
jgi:CRP-like cAMP-binding protein